MTVLLRYLRHQWDRAAAVAATVAGAVLIIVAWAGASGSEFAAGQIPYVISGGIGGLFLLGIAATLWLSADIRDEWRKLDLIESRLGPEPAAGPSRLERFQASTPGADAGPQIDRSPP